jgi:non-homologous end joining protein Ku
MLDEKSKGKDITIPVPALQGGGKVIDIIEALRWSMERIPAKKKSATTAAKKKKTVRKIIHPLPRRRSAP